MNLSNNQDHFEIPKRDFVEPVQNNVDVLTYSLVSKVIMDDTNRAIGVEVKRFGHYYQYFTSNEVILSAGAIGSAQG